ncbi:Npr-27 [Aphelenchoides besseyi]|nr:Npr-27 [Aphelenchoides besseyi]KAI6236508.1 Npr-27 [Aphelenchoides besseyi]
MLLIYIVVTFYSLAFLIGIIGNSFVMIQMVRRKLCFPANHRQATARERSRVFIFMLATTDFFVLLITPFTLAQLLQAQWIFGSFICRFYTAVDLSGKYFSVVILTSMSIERYLVVCTRFRYIATPYHLSIVPLALGVIFCVLIPIVPIIMYTTLFELTLEEDGRVYKQSICLHYMPEPIFTVYINYTFICGFALPLIIMACCYIQLVRHVRRKFRERTAVNRSPHSSIRGQPCPRYMGNLTRSIIRIAIFHFFCWCPFWVFSLLPSFTEAFGIPFTPYPEWFNNAKLFANLLPYVNSAGNAFFYAFLNRDIRKHLWRPNSRLRTGGNSTNVAGTALQSAVLQSDTFNPASD